MRRVRIPLHPGMADPEAVGVHERRLEVDVVEFLTTLGVVHVVQPHRRAQHVRMRTRADL